jgi:hypothetical protein
MGAVRLRVRCHLDDCEVAEMAREGAGDKHSIFPRFSAYVAGTIGALTVVVVGVVVVVTAVKKRSSESAVVPRLRRKVRTGAWDPFGPFLRGILV